MKFSGDVILIDGPTCAADISSLIADWVQQQFGSLEASMPRGYAKDKRSTIAWTGQILNGPDRPRAYASVENRVGLIKYWQKIKRFVFSLGMGLRKLMERSPGAPVCKRPPVSFVIRRDCRKSHEVQSADSQSGDDDD